MKNNFKISDFLPYIVFALCIVIFLIVLRPIIGIIALIAMAYVLYMTYKKITTKNEKNLKHIEKLNDRFDSLTKEVIFDMPFPLVVTDEKAKILWYNTPFI
ncbi:MAG: phosphoesterase, partial [Peptoniphilus lacydonensis]|nr:phosphoesterase [Peptoniphilus lacydonensis]